MSTFANESRLAAIRRAEGQPVLTTVERDGVCRLEAPKRDPEPEHPIVYGRMAGWAMIAAAIAIFIVFTILGMSQDYLNSIGG